ncbi:MAG: hypothetical protein ACRCVJ_11670 [Clostridium sp.]
MTFYYGAKINGQVLYTTKIELEDCWKFPDTINEDIYEKQLEELITSDGLADPKDFTYGFLTKDEYENRPTKGNERSFDYELFNNDKEED